MQRLRLAWHELPPGVRTNIVAAAVLLALICATFAPFLFGDRTLQNSAAGTSSLFSSGSRYPAPAAIRYDRELDPGAPAWQTEPDFALEHNTLASEKGPPLWNPYSGYGMPLAAEMQPQPYYPPAWIPIVFDTAKSWNVFVILRLYLAGLFLFLFLRLFVGLLPALVGASSFMYAGYFLLYVTMPHLSVEVLIPGLLYGIERLLRAPSLATARLLCAVLAICVLGGMPEATLLAFSFAALYAAARLWGRAAARETFRRIAVFGSIGSVLALGITMIQLLPFAEFVPQSFTFHHSGVGLGHEQLNADVLGLYFAPLLHGPPWSNIFGSAQSPDTGARGFFGSAAAFFALVAVFAQIDGIARRRSAFAAPVVFFALVAVGLVMKRFGEWPFSELGRLPGFDLIIFPKYEEAVVACAVAALAGFGAALVLERRAPLWAIVFAIAVPLTVLTIAAGADQGLYHALAQNKDFFIGSLAAALAALAAAAALAFAVRHGRLSGLRAGAAAIALVVVELNAGFVIPLYYVVNGNAPDSASALRGTDYVRFLQQHSAGGERFFGESGILYPEWSAVFAISDPRAIDALYPQRYLPFITAFFGGRMPEARLTRFDGGNGIDFSAPLDRRFLDLSSVRYVGANVQLDRPGSPFRLAFRQPGASIYEYRSPLPRVAVYRRVIRAASPESALATVTAPGFDPRSEAIVEADSGDLGALAAAPRSPVKAGVLAAYSSRYARAEVAADGPALVVLNDTMLPGWRATVDGRPARVFIVDSLFRGVPIDSGRHTVEFRYEPVSFKLGAVVCGLSLLLFALTFLAGRARPRHRSAESSPET